jgi:spermidine synthase
LYDLLDDNGILATQCDAPRWHQERFVSIINSLKEVFLFSLNDEQSDEKNNKTVLPYLSSVASLPTGMWGFACVSKNQEVFTRNNQREKDFSEDFYEKLFYYNQEIQQAAFYLPNFIKNLLK